MSTEQLPLLNRRALVTGASRGIGRSIALALAAAGADIVLSARSRAELEQVAAEVRGCGRRALAVPCDITYPAQVERMAANVADEYGGVDILVNNAGAAASHKFIG